MVRAPCCEKKGLKKGSWTPEEDLILINHVKTHGHKNWRALPKLAGLLRCGKSCRLRWINYLKPGIKRGNFTREEENMIIQLHETLGNRWSAIAARLPGRTDNEIKNVWNTHLKKRLPQQDQKRNSKQKQPSSSDVSTLTTAESLDEFWSQVLSLDDLSDDTTTFPATATAEGIRSTSSSVYHNVDYWYDVYMGAQELS
ncbi:hypothetical protein VNO78_21971 [Psophocarpus tetragonolobus]|uniref:Uncharacterized protein n=1 Tax=Psophocarpus tetragonolobus TaxID=3891 RepID=A0AAN9SCH5_PSOTE